MIKPETVSTLIAELYRDVVHPDGWRNFFSMLIAELNCSSVSLYIDDVGGRPTDKFVTINQPDHAINEFAQYYHEIDLWGLALPNLPLFQFHTSEAMVSCKKLKSSEIYNDYLKKHDLRWCCGAYIENPASDHALKLGIQRGHNHKPFNDDEINTLNLLIPHLQNALNIHRRVNGVEQIRTSFEMVGEIVDSAAFLIDTAYKLVAKNSVADKMLKQSIAQEREGKLHFSSTALHKLVHNSVSQMHAFTENKTNHYQQFASIGDDTSGYQVRVDAMPLPTNILGITEMGVLVQLKPKAAQLNINQDGLRQLFGLTKMETEIAYWQCQGYSAPEIADALAIKESTVRTHTKSVYNKLNISKQSELVATVLSSLASS